MLFSQETHYWRRFAVLPRARLLVRDLWPVCTRADGPEAPPHAWNGLGRWYNRKGAWYNRAVAARARHGVRHGRGVHVAAASRWGAAKHRERALLKMQMQEGSSIESVMILQKCGRKLSERSRKSNLKQGIPHNMFHIMGTY